MVTLTRQSVAWGPVQPAAQWTLQQSMGFGPRHLWLHCSAHCSLVTTTTKTQWEVSYVTWLKTVQEIKDIDRLQITFLTVIQSCCPTWAIDTLRITHFTWKHKHINILRLHMSKRILTFFSQNWFKSPNLAQIFSYMVTVICTCTSKGVHLQQHAGIAGFVHDVPPLDSFSVTKQRIMGNFHSSSEDLWGDNTWRRHRFLFELNFMWKTFQPSEYLANCVCCFLPVRLLSCSCFSPLV